MSIIPATQRPDGTWRKERKVKTGYVPQEEVALYESKGKQWSQKPVGPVGLPPHLQAQIKAKQEKKTTNAEIRKASKSKCVASEGVLAADRILIPKTSVNKTKPTTPTETVEDVTNSVNKLDIDDRNTDKLKKIRNLRKKLKEIENLDQKIKSGELLNPDPDQLKKVSRRNGVIEELRVLEES